MSAHVTQIVNAMITQLQGWTDLSYVTTFSRSGDLMDLIKRGKYPFIDIEVDNRKSGQAGNQRLYDYVRHEYNVVVRFCLAYPDKEVVMNGQFPDPEDPEDETPVRKGLWDMAEDIEAAIDSDLSFSGTVKNNAVIPTIMVDSFYYQEGLVWVGRGAMIFSVTKDIAKR